MNVPRAEQYFIFGEVVLPRAYKLQKGATSRCSKRSSSPLLHQQGLEEGAEDHARGGCREEEHQGHSTRSCYRRTSSSCPKLLLRFRQRLRGGSVRQGRPAPRNPSISRATASGSSSTSAWPRPRRTTASARGQSATASNARVGELRVALAGEKEQRRRAARRGRPRASAGSRRPSSAASGRAGAGRCAAGARGPRGSAGAPAAARTAAGGTSRRGTARAPAFPAGGRGCSSSSRRACRAGSSAIPGDAETITARATTSGVLDRELQREASAEGVADDAAAAGRGEDGRRGPRRTRPASRGLSSAGSRAGLAVPGQVDRDAAVRAREDRGDGGPVAPAAHEAVQQQDGRRRRRAAFLECQGTHESASLSGSGSASPRSRDERVVRWSTAPATGPRPPRRSPRRGRGARRGSPRGRCAPR